MNLRLGVMESSQTEGPRGARSLFITSSSFSSFSSSNLDTESTASFFQDNSVSLGRLIGLGPAERGINSYLPGRNHLDGRGESISSRGAASSRVSEGGRVEMSSEGQGICIPLILGTIEKMNRRKDKSS